MRKKKSDRKVKGASRAARTFRILLMMALLGAGLALFSIYANRRDIDVAIGPQSEAQHAFFADAAERPDMAIFFKGMTPTQRKAMSANIGRYDDPKLAKLIAKLLETFDVGAREALTASLTQLAKTQPKAVAEQLSVGGSFQQLAIRTALGQAGPTAYPVVAERFTNGDARPNAIAFLASVGKPAVPATLPMLDHKEKDVRLAAADTLGKIRAPEALPKLNLLYNGSLSDEHFGYLAAIAGIGDPSSQKLLEYAINDTTLPGPQRSQAALGLGRIASDSSITLLWRYADNDDPRLAQSAVSALQLAGPKALRLSTGTPELKIRVARGIQGPEADSVLTDALKLPALRYQAAQASIDRPTIVSSLAATLQGLDTDGDGDVADAIIASLASTAEGRSKLGSFEKGPFSGLVARRLDLERAQ